MPIESNIQLLKDQIELFQAMRSDITSAIAAKRQQLVALDGRARALQQSVRAAARDTGLRSRSTLKLMIWNVESICVIALRPWMALESRLSSLTSVLAQLAGTWADLLQAQIRLREQSTPRADQRKIEALQHDSWTS